jgi:sugar lactone lactonase YvrE
MAIRSSLLRPLLPSLLALALLWLPSRPAQAWDPKVIKGPSTLVYPDFWHTPLGVHKGTAELLRIFTGGRARFNDPQGVACVRMKENGPENPQLTVFGVNSGDGQIVFNPDMFHLSVYGETGSGEGQFVKPTGIAALPDGRVAVADTGNHRIALLQYKKGDLSWKGSLGSYGSGKGQFNGPTWLAYDSQGRLYVSDTGNHRVQVFAADGRYLFDFGAQAAADNSLVEPQAIAVIDPLEPYSVSPMGAIYVVDQYHGRVQKFDLAGKFLAQATGLDADKYLVYFTGIGLDYFNNLWVADRGNHMIHKFDPYLQHIDSWGRHGSDDGMLESPRGLSIYRHFGQVFIAEKESAQYLWIGADVQDIKIGRAIGPQGRPLMRVDYLLTEKAKLDCWIETLEGEKLHTLLTHQGSVEQGLHSITWDGLMEGGARIPTGAYNIVFIAEATYSSATYYKKKAVKRFWIR